MTIPAVCHHCARRFGVMAVAPPSRCPRCRERFDAFDPDRVIRAVPCSVSAGWMSCSSGGSITSRSTSHLIRALDEFRSLGIAFCSFSEALDTSTPTGKVMFTVIAAIAEFERALIQERCGRGSVGRVRPVSSSDGLGSAPIS